MFGQRLKMRRHGTGYEIVSDMAVFPESRAAAQGAEHAVESNELKQIDGEGGEHDPGVSVPREE